MRKRIIPVLLVDCHKRLVKTVRFDERTYVGDPFNVIRLFNEKEVDEICLLDISASRNLKDPDLGFIKEMSSECFMPMSYGGGISTVKQCESLNRAGVEKFVLGKSALNTDFVRDISATFGSQAIVACVDVKGSGDAARCVTHSGRRETDIDPLIHCLRLEEMGIGEIILQSIDRDGMRTGYDLEIIQKISEKLTVPLIALGGAGNTFHLAEALHAGASAAASGSAFVFIGDLRAVLITYPSMAQMDKVIELIS